MDEREELIISNLGLVHSCAARFKGRGIEYEDLFQIGCIGLVKAADNFDVERGLMFSTYAVPTILGEIKRVFRDTGAIKVSRSLKELGFKVIAEKERIEKTTGGEVSINMLSERLGINSAEISEALCALQPTVSLTVCDDDGEEQLDVPAPSNENEIYNKIFVDSLLVKLKKEEQNLIKLRYYFGKTQNESAKLLNMSQVQVSRMEKKILGKLRRMTENNVSA